MGQRTGQEGRKRAQAVMPNNVFAPPGTHLVRAPFSIHPVWSKLKQAQIGCYIGEKNIPISAECAA